MAAEMIIIPQAWVEEVELPDRDWMLEYAGPLISEYPQIFRYIHDVSYHVGVSWKLLVTRMELEQGGISYAWNGSTSHYGGGSRGDRWKLFYLCGVDKTDSGPRKGGWFNPKRQFLGCALRFKHWYRGIYPSNENWENWLGLSEDPRFAPGVPITRGDQTIIPLNQASADCLRYTSSMTAQHHLAEIGRRWFPEDYEIEEATMRRDDMIEIESGSIEVDDRYSYIEVHSETDPDKVYYVTVNREDGALERCSCPAFGLRPGGPCKHIRAVIYQRLLQESA